MQTDLVAILPGAGPSELPTGVRLVSSGDHVAILGPRRARSGIGRQALLQVALERARLLEGLLSFGTVLPGLPGQKLSRTDVAGLITANLPLLKTLAARLQGRVQYQITVRWQADRALGRFGLHSIRPDPEAATRELAAALRGRFDDLIAAAGAEILSLPVAEDVIYNAAVLVQRCSDASLDAVVQEIDDLWPDGFAIRMIGPSPAVSFASLRLERIDRQSMRAACAAFSLSPGFSAQDLSRARRSALMNAEPGTRDSLLRHARILEGLERRDGNKTPFHLVDIWSEGRSSPGFVAADAA